jgi:hypothetical protein
LGEFQDAAMNVKPSALQSPVDTRNVRKRIVRISWLLRQRNAIKQWFYGVKRLQMSVKVG